MKTLKFVAILMLAMLASCGYKDDSAIADELLSGIVFVENSGYYEVHLPDGNSIFFTSCDEKGGVKGLVFDRNLVEDDFILGTGFFVGKEGIIATNAHLVSTPTKETDVKKCVATILDAARYLLNAEYNEKGEGSAEANGLKAKMEEIESIDVSKITLEYINRVRASYYDMKKEMYEDFKYCDVIDIDKEHDLALIRLLLPDEEMPEGNFIFDVAGEDPYETYSVADRMNSAIHGNKNNQIYMLGFNQDPRLIRAGQNIKIMIDSGQICDVSDDQMIFQLKAYQGSCGSPIVNRNGELIAVNSARINGLPDLHKGTRAKHLYNLLNKRIENESF